MHSRIKMTLNPGWFTTKYEVASRSLEKVMDAARALNEAGAFEMIFGVPRQPVLVPIPIESERYELR